MIERYDLHVLAGPDREASGQAAPADGGIFIPATATNIPSETAESAAQFGEIHTADPAGGLLAGFAASDKYRPRLAVNPHLTRDPPMRPATGL